MGLRHLVPGSSLAALCLNANKTAPLTRNHTEQLLQVNPSTRGSVSPSAGASRQSYSRSASNCSVDDDRASDFEDEPVPYCQSHMEEIHDAPTPVGNIVDRVQVCRGGRCFSLGGTTGVQGRCSFARSFVLYLAG